MTLSDAKIRAENLAAAVRALTLPNDIRVIEKALREAMGKAGMQEDGWKPAD